jgi:1-aminocyclopropane-1-carboxylate deaminase/D-cysteine desulfhydrase-like pyridoxal-dependent ACC family enzyme
MNTSAPKIERYGEFYVARDDLLIGGTKSRYLGVLFDKADEVVYASPAQGAAQIALAVVAKTLGKTAKIFVAQRSMLHPNTELARCYGALIEQVSPGYFAVVSARAREYVQRYYSRRSILLAPFGLRMPEAVQCLTAACRTIQNYDEIWCAGGSGTLAAALCKAFPRANVNVVSVGHKIGPGEAGDAAIHIYDRPFDRKARIIPPFPCNLTFDAKAYEVMLDESKSRRALFWNVDKDHTI